MKLYPNYITFYKTLNTIPYSYQKNLILESLFSYFSMLLINEFSQN